MALSIVATPIGNTADITLRALEVLSAAELILAEDTRVTRQLLDRYRQQGHAFTARIERLDEHVRGERLARIVEEIVGGTEAAVVSCAGTPGVSDPGESVVAACAAAGVSVVPIPGPSALAAIISVADFPAEPVAFYGFLPKKKGRQSELRRLKEASGRYGLASAIIYESPHRVRKTLEELTELLGAETHVVIGRELTKKFEEVWYGSLTQAIEHFKAPKGEFVLLIHLSTT